MKRISLIIPVYNAARYLPQIMESLRSQSWDNLQILFSDDGSTDDSLRLLHSYAAADSRVTVLSGENRGVSAARNRALAAADGDYIGFADADDLLAPDYLSVLGSLLDSGSADVACCGFSRVFADRGTEDALPILKTDAAPKDRSEFFSLLLDPKGYALVIWNKLFRRSALTQQDGTLQLFSEDLHIVEDGEYIFRSRVQSAVFTPLPLYRYFVRSSGTLYGAMTPQKRTELTARMRIVRLCEAESPAVRAMAEMRYQKGVRDMLFHAVLSKQGDEIRDLFPELKVFRQALFDSPHLTAKQKLQYHVYYPIIRLNLHRIGTFLMKVLSSH